MSLPANTALPPIRPSNLAEAVERARHPRNHATAKLKSHRDELLRMRQAGESVESLVGGLHLLGIEIGLETLRRWLQQELGSKPAKRRKPKAKAILPPSAEEGPSAALALPTAPAESAVAPEPAPPEAPQAATVHPSWLILPGETPEQALRRRLAALDAHDAALKAAQAAPNGSQAKNVSMPPS